LQLAEKLRGVGDREMVTPPNCRREFTKAKQPAFLGTELRYLKLLVGRPVWKLSNWGDIKK
jgi:hypothetical protein